MFARRGLGLRLPSIGSHIVEEARAVAAFVEPPGFRPILAVSAYLIDGKGTQPANRAILTRIGRCAEAQGGDCQVIIGGDFQSKPADVDGTGFPRMVKGRTVAPSTARGTYRTARGATTIDYFVITDELVDVVESISTVECSGLKGHTPVQVKFLPRAVAPKNAGGETTPDFAHRPRLWTNSSAAELAGSAARGGGGAKECERGQRH